MATSPPKGSSNPKAAAAKAQAAKKANLKGGKPQFQTEETKKTAYELVRLRNDFYRDNYRRLIAIFLLLLTLLFATCYWIYYLTSHRPPPRYFATNAAGGLIPLTPLNQPSISDIALQNWATRAAVAAFTFNYVQLNQQLETAKDTYFTDTGGTAFVNALINSGNLDAVTTGKFIVTSQPTGAPEIITRGEMNQGPYKGRYAWVVKIPLQLNYESVLENIASKRYVDLQMTIVRTSSLVENAATSVDSLLGIGISQLLAQRGTAPPNPSNMPTQATLEADPNMAVVSSDVFVHPSLSMAV